MKQKLEFKPMEQENMNQNTFFDLLDLRINVKNFQNSIFPGQYLSTKD